MRPAPSKRATLADTTPGVGMGLQISGRRWTVTDHSSYDNAEGYHVDEWECEVTGKKPETAYLLCESDTGVRWYFTRPIPIAAVTLSGGKPFADVAGTLTEPPEALVYRGLAHGLDETTAGRYAEDPGESVQKTTWDYWDAKHELNLAVERWADGRVDCYHGRLIDPGTITVAGGAAGAARGGAASAGLSVGPTSFIIAAVAFFVMLVVAGTVEISLSVGLALAAVIALAASLRGSARIARGWLVGVVGLGTLFLWFPPLTSAAGVAALMLVPAALTRWIAMDTLGATARPVRAAFVSLATATLAAGLYTYYSFAPVPRSFGQYVLAIGPAPLAGIVAAVVAWGVRRVSGPR